MVKVGIFDSGIGGFSILEPLLTRFPHWEIFYIADDAFAPYGKLDAAVIQERAVAITEQLVAQGVELIIVACNTATAYAVELLRQHFSLPFVGVEPYLNIVNHHPELVDAKGVVLSTTATDRSARFARLKAKLDPNQFLDYVGLDNLAEIVETALWKGESEGLFAAVDHELRFLKEHNYEFAVLGCTHYPLVGTFIQQSLALNATYGPSEFVLNRAADLLSNISEDRESYKAIGHFNLYLTSHSHWEEWQKRAPLLDRVGRLMYSSAHKK